MEDEPKTLLVTLTGKDRPGVTSAIFGALSAAGLSVLDALEQRGELRTYHLLPVVRAELLVRSGRVEDARRCFQLAIDMCSNPAERAHLQRRLSELAVSSPAPRPAPR